MFKVGDKDTRTMSIDIVLISLFLTLSRLHTPCSSIFITDFEQVNAHWNVYKFSHLWCKIKWPEVQCNWNEKLF